MLLPKIIIRYGFLLDPFLREYFILKNEDKTKTLIEYDVLIKNIELYKSEWEKIGDKILKAILELLPLNFIHNVIDVYIVSYYPWYRGISEPVVIRGNLEPNDFVDTLTHEMIHFLSSNKIQSNIYTIKILEEMFPEEKDLKARNHSIINAIQKYILVDVLKDNKRYLGNVEKIFMTPVIKRLGIWLKKKGIWK